MHVITADQLRKAAPRCMDPAAWIAPLNDAMLLTGIADDVNVMVEFLAQFAHETSSLNRLEESLVYSAERLHAVWPSRFPTVASGVPFAGKPHALAEHVYGGRMGNGPEGSGDGWYYRGRGAGITGRDNYTRLGKRLNDPLILPCPDRLCTRPLAAMAAATFWVDHPKLTAWAIDTPLDDDHADFVSITRLINGGTIGLAEREKFREAFRTSMKPTP